MYRLDDLAVLSTGIGWAAPEAPREQKPATETIILKIEGWTCASCEKDIRRALMAVPGVRQAEVSYAAGGAVVQVERGRITPKHLIRAVAEASTLFAAYRATVVPNGSLVIAQREERGWKSWFGDLFQ